MEIFEKIEKSSKNIVFVYTICGDIEEAKHIGYSAIEEKLAISMDYWIVNSIYPWDNLIKEIKQYFLVFSTQKSKSANLVKHIEAEHSYKIPMVVVCKTNMANLPYSHWVDNFLKSEDVYTKEIDFSKKDDVNSLDLK